MTPKELAAQRLRNEYRDIYQRYGLEPAAASDPENGNWDSENQNLFSGQAIMFFYLNNLMVSDDIAHFEQGLEHCKVQDGLYSRWPVGAFGSERHGISHDEMTGITIGCIATNNSKIPRDFIEYGTKHNWAFIDEYPGTDPYSSADNLKKFAGRIRQPKDRALYKIAAGKKVSIFENLNILISSYLSSKKVKTDTSTRVMWWHKFQAIKITGNDSKILKFAAYLFDKNNKKIYGSPDYMEEVYSIYFAPEHPFQELIKGLYL